MHLPHLFLGKLAVAVAAAAPTCSVVLAVFLVIAAQDAIRRCRVKTKIAEIIPRAFVSVAPRRIKILRINAWRHSIHDVSSLTMSTMAFKMICTNTPWRVGYFNRNILAHGSKRSQESWSNVSAKCGKANNRNMRLGYILWRCHIRCPMAPIIRAMMQKASAFHW